MDVTRGRWHKQAVFYLLAEASYEIDIKIFILYYIRTVKYYCIIVEKGVIRVVVHYDHIVQIIHKSTKERKSHIRMCL